MGQNTEHFTLNKSWFHTIWGSGPNIVIDEWKSRYLPDVNLYHKKPCIIHRNLLLKGFSCMWMRIIYYDRFSEIFFKMSDVMVQIFQKILTWKFTAGNRHKQNSRFCKEIREDNFRFWWSRVHEDASQGMYMSKIEIFFFTAPILQNQRMLCCGECFHN